MAGIDSILGILIQNSADELRLGTDEAPRMYRRGAPLKLSIPVTSESTLRHLLGPLLTEASERTLRAAGKLEQPYRPDGGEPFFAIVSLRADGRAGFDVVFHRGGAPAMRQPGLVEPSPSPSSPPPPAPPAPPATPAPPVDRGGEGAGREPTLSTGLLALLQRAASSRASDLHLCTGEVPSLRVDGALRRLDDAAPASVADLLGALLAPSVKESLATGRSIDLAFSVRGVGRIRLNVYQAAGGLAAALRLLPTAAPALADLHLPIALDDLVDLPQGLVLVCGPTGSGKSSTAAALAQEALRRHARLLISLEDPIEYQLQPGAGLVRQRQIGRDVVDFPTGLRDALREDPDLLLIGEMRDPETISLALTAAETGHLVLASMHSRSSASSVERIVDAYPAGRQQQIRAQLADSLRAVVTQRLLPRARGGGRLPALEVLRGTSNVASLIREGKTAQLSTALQSGRKENMLPLERCLADLVRAGQVTREQAAAVANDATALAGYLSA